MDRVDITLNELANIIENGEIVGQGNIGIVYKLDDLTLFKFKFKKFIDCFKIKGNKFSLRDFLKNEFLEEVQTRKEVESILIRNKFGMEEEHIINANKLKNNIKYSKLTKGLVYFNNYCIGYTLEYHKNMVPLYDYLQKHLLTSDQRNSIEMQMKRAFQELIDNNIYLSDMTTHNILYNPNSSEIQLIDFEDSLYCTGECLPHKEKDMIRTLKYNLLYLSEHDENEPNLIDLL